MDKNREIRAAAAERGIKTRTPSNEYVATRKLETIITEFDARRADLLGHAKTGSGIKGRGIASVDDKLKQGRYTINTRKLADGVVQIRSARGGAVHRFPSQAVSDAVASALRKIVSGGALSFEDISGLSESERRYLHTVATECGVATNLPQPKDEQAAQSDRFTVLRGELMAANDNPELVREFKTLILKMSASGQLPKGAVREVLLDLVALGK